MAVSVPRGEANVKNYHDLQRETKHGKLHPCARKRNLVWTLAAVCLGVYPCMPMFGHFQLSTCCVDGDQSKLLNPRTLPIFRRIMLFWGEVRGFFAALKVARRSSRSDVKTVLRAFLKIASLDKHWK